jgi:thiamine transport system ATP-binding protein
MLRVEQAVVRFGTHAALAGIDIEVGATETVVVLGPSGCGKSTLLRAIAGLEPLTSGRIEWDGTDLAGVAPHRRRFGLMFQDYALFPHRDVRGNVEFGLRMTGAPTAARAARVREVLALVGLEGYEARRVATLSGGEQQRVALARSLAPSPRLLMFDEPLGALDRSLRERLLDQLQELIERAALPVLYVTHDHDEAFALADRVVVMRAGRVVQSGSPAAVWESPADEWTARFLGFGPAVDAPVEHGVARTAWGAFAVPANVTNGLARVVLRPGAVRLDAGSLCRGVVHRRGFAGDHVALTVEVDGAPPVDVRAPLAGAPEPGTTVGLAVAADGALVYAPRVSSD